MKYIIIPKEETFLNDYLKDFDENKIKNGLKASQLCYLFASEIDEMQMILYGLDKSDIKLSDRKAIIKKKIEILKKKIRSLKKSKYSILTELNPKFIFWVLLKKKFKDTVGEIYKPWEET